MDDPLAEAASAVTVVIVGAVAAGMAVRLWRVTARMWAEIYDWLWRRLWLI